MSSPDASPKNKNLSKAFAPIEDLIEEARNGRMFILVDDEDRENEGDLIIPAQMATPDAVNFMARFGRGLICLALTRTRVETLDLALMSSNNQSRHQTAFTNSIEAREGISTGISASDRARTIATAIDPLCGQNDIVSPGHVFPLIARDGGTLVRAGHTEAAVDIARLAGLNPSGVICEVMNEDGTMARLDNLTLFAEEHGLKIASIADLIAYRLHYDRLVSRVLECPFDSPYGEKLQMILYRDEMTQTEHIALIKGTLPDDDAPVPIRMHALNMLEDVLGLSSIGSGETFLQRCMRYIAEQAYGVIVLIRETQKDTLSRRLSMQNAERSEELRDYGVGAQILLDLGIRHITLLSKSNRTIIGVEGYGLKISPDSPIDPA